MLKTLQAPPTPPPVYGSAAAEDGTAGGGGDKGERRAKIRELVDEVRGGWDERL